MERCFWGRVATVRVGALFLYVKGGAVARVLYAMKYGGRKKLCFCMGQLMADECASSGLFEKVDCIVPVPLHPSRLKRRGYNQSEWLSKGISSRTGIPVCGNALFRTRDNASQTRKGSFERWMNAEGLFGLLPGADALEGKHVLLVDDVLTTGSTLTACADALSGVKGLRISIAALAWTKQA